MGDQERTAIPLLTPNGENALAYRPQAELPTDFSVLTGCKYPRYSSATTSAGVTKAVLFLLVTSPVLPVVPWALENWYPAVAGAVLALVQIGLALLIYLNKRHPLLLNTLRRLAVVYSLVLLLALVAFEVWTLAAGIQRNQSHCGDYSMYTICHKRGGVMTTQLLMALLYPGVDLFVACMLAYVLRCVGDRVKHLREYPDS